MGVHRNIDANFLRGVMPKVPSKKHPYENFGMPYVFLWILQAAEAIGAEVVFPVFAEGENGKDFTDFNDLATKSRLGKIGLEQQVAPVIEKILSDRKAQAQTQAQSQARVKRI